MRSMVIQTGTLLMVVFFASVATATEGTVVRGLFGPRVIGGPIEPQSRTRFERGVQRGPTGEILGLQRNLRPRDPWGEGIDVSALPSVRQRDQRFGYDRQTIRSAVPDVWPTMPTPARPPVVAPAQPRPTVPSDVVPFRPVQPPPVVQPQRPADAWFRAPRR
jgi:hypothetical protein